LDGKIISYSKVRVMRDKVEVGAGEITGLKLVNEDVKELEKNQECGVRFKGKLKILEGDILEAWTEEKRMKTL